MSKEMRGLTQFISSIRSAENKEDEQQKVAKELGNIRTKFTSNSQLSDYDKRKYVWKLVYMYMLGYNVEVGHMVAMGMIASKSLSVKQVGYTACSILFTEKSELLRLVIQTLKQDLNSNNDILQSFALVFIGNMGNSEIAESLTLDVLRLLLSPSTRAIVRKKASLALIRLFRKNRECIPQEDSFKQSMCGLFDDGNIGVLTAISSLLLGLISMNPKGYEFVVGKVIVILTKVCFADPRNRSVYKYYNTICPWLQVKLLRILQYFPTVCAGLVSENGVLVLSRDEQHKTTAAKLANLLTELCNRIVLTKNPNKNNADHAILFEAIHLIINMARVCQHLKTMPPSLNELLNTSSNLLAKFITLNEPNFRYLGLDYLVKLASITECIGNIRVHQNVILSTLVDADVSLRKRALDLLYVICDSNNVEVVVAQLLDCLSNESVGLRDDIVLKIILLSEKYGGYNTWYVDTVMTIAENYGEYFIENLWYRVIQVLTSHPDIQAYSVIRAYNISNSAVDLPQNSVRFLTYILGEFSCQVLDHPEYTIDPFVLFNNLHKHYRVANAYTKAIMLTAFSKIAFTFPDVKTQVDEILVSSNTSLDLEVQQRSTEFLLLSQQDTHILEQVLDVMPPYEDAGIQELEQKMTTVQVTDKSWTEGMLAENFADDEDDDMDDEEDGGVGGSIAAPTGSAADHHMDVHEDDGGSGKAVDVNDVYFLRNLRGHTDPVIFKNDTVIISCKTQAENGLGKMIIDIKNITSNVLYNLKLGLPNSEHFKIQVKPNDIPSLNANDTGRFLLLWQILKPFEEPIHIRLLCDAPMDVVSTSSTTSTSNSLDILALFDASNMQNTTVPRVYPFAVPLVCSKFLAPNTTTNENAPLTHVNYLDYWKFLGNQAIAKLQCKNKTDGSINFISSLVPNVLNVSVIPNCDKNPNNIYLSSVFISNTKLPNGQNLHVPVLMRIETKQNSTICRVTVNSASQMASNAILHSIKTILNADIIG